MAGELKMSFHGGQDNYIHHTQHTTGHCMGKPV